MKRRLLALLLVLALCLSGLALPVFAAERDTAEEEALAAELKSLGLFRGVSETDFALRRAPSRTEALVMLIRMLGKEQTALSGSWRHPFTDVESWAAPYVGYAYETGLTSGVAADRFGGGSDASSAMYLTFVLRAMGYSDAGGADFTWDAPYTLARSIGVLDDSTNTETFWRADVVRISCAALPVCLKGSGQTLSDKLIAEGAFTREQYESCRGLSGQTPSRTVDLSRYAGVLEALPPYSGEASVVLNGNAPFFTAAELTGEAFEQYGPLDALGRCTYAYANCGRELMPTEPRGEIGQVKPSGWHTANYHELIDGMYLYNRCHLIAYQLTAENANVCNLITGTRYLNVTGMAPYEDQVAAYINKTGNHVLYRAVPCFSGDELVARGVVLEACSVEDAGAGLRFCVFCYNVQPGIDIDYATGDSCVAETPADTEQPTDSGDRGSIGDPEHCDYVVNLNTGVFHRPNCASVRQMKEKNKWYFQGSRTELLDAYKPCANCKP